MGVQNSKRVPTVLLAHTIIWDGLFWTLNPKSWDSFFKIIARLTGSHRTTILGGKMAQRDPKVYEIFADLGKILAGRSKKGWYGCGAGAGRTPILDIPQRAIGSLNIYLYSDNLAITDLAV